MANIWPSWEERGEWRRFHNHELHSSYHSPVIVKVVKSRRLSWAGYVTRIVGDRIAFRNLTGKPVGNRPLGRSSCRWEDYVRMDLKQLGVNVENWVHWLSIGIIAFSIKPPGSISLGVS